MATKHYEVFIIYVSGRFWAIKGPGLKQPLPHFVSETLANQVRDVLEAAFAAGRAYTRDTLESIGERVEEEKTDPEVGKLSTVPEVKS